ncbi:MAG TPA: twin-arginine translocation signal domain-containing protein [Hyphomicrobiaceae bacterium]|nr:twin-arginine translocation signal domain-containing protein [Hyphomicrobiaceae bacterium]
MDRRNFLKTTGAVAVAASAATAPASAAEEEAPDRHLPAPAILSGTRVLALSSQWVQHAGCGPERLARRIEAATGGRYRFAIGHEMGDAEVTYGSAGRHIARHPAFAFFAGLPFAQGLGAADQAAWLSVGGGGMLWDELAAGFAFKPLLAGQAGSGPGVWASARLESPDDFARATLHVDGLAADVVQALGAASVRLPADELGQALAGGRIQAAEWLGPYPAEGAASPGPLSQRVYEPAFHRGGMALTLDVRKDVWLTLGDGDRLLFEACAAQEHQLSLAEMRAHAALARQLQAPAKWPVRLAWSEAVEEALDEAMADILARVAATDAAARRIHDSYQAFRHLLGEDLIA